MSGTGILPGHLFLAAFADGDYQDDGQGPDNNAERGQQDLGLVLEQIRPDHAERFCQPHTLTPLPQQFRRRTGRWSPRWCARRKNLS